MSVVSNVLCSRSLTSENQLVNGHVCGKLAHKITSGIAIFTG